MEVFARPFALLIKRKGAGLGGLRRSVAAGERGVRWAHVKTYATNDEFFEDLQGLIRRLEQGGNQAAAEELRAGFACLNGLTDGWATLMDSMKQALSRWGTTMTDQDRDALNGMLKTVRRIVSRR